MTSSLSTKSKISSTSMSTGSISTSTQCMTNTIENSSLHIKIRCSSTERLLLSIRRRRRRPQELSWRTIKSLGCRSSWHGSAQRLSNSMKWSRNSTERLRNTNPETPPSKKTISFLRNRLCRLWNRINNLRLKFKRPQILIMLSETS